VTDAVVDAPPDAGDHEVRETVTRRQVSWITTTVVVAPPPVIVTVAERRAVPVFAEAVSVRTVPEARAPVGATSNQDALEDAVHVPPVAVIADRSLTAPPAGASHHAVEGTIFAGPAACVTVNDRLAPSAVMVKVAVRAAIVGFS
jgi:hypothetical protein